MLLPLTGWKSGVWSGPVCRGLACRVVVARLGWSWRVAGGDGGVDRSGLAGAKEPDRSRDQEDDGGGHGPCGPGKPYHRGRFFFVGIFRKPHILSDRVPYFVIRFFTVEFFAVIADEIVLTCCSYYAPCLINCNNFCFARIYCVRTVACETCRISAISSWSYPSNR